ncbi:hypothetical protein GGR56DRAFT_684776 [Xylariaceae sp. FL0804]|nr:hypothetical protein GGR56DRAFT_684776 [Xylariaceae sp. FL0804]
MPSTPSKRPSSTAASPSKVPLNGLFKEGVWRCNCQPRLPALLLTVKREGENRGRAFYRCKNSRDQKNQCDFFLWSEDARAREQDNLFSNSRSETTGARSTGNKKQRQTTLHESISPCKRKRAWGERTPLVSLADLGEMPTPTTPTAATVAASNSSALRASNSKSNPTATAPAGTTRPPLSDDHDTASTVSSSSSDSDSDSVSSNPSSHENAGPTTNTTSTSTMTMAMTPTVGSKRKRPVADIDDDDDDDDDEFGGFSSGEEMELAAIVDRSGSKAPRLCSTPPPPPLPHSSQCGHSSGRQQCGCTIVTPAAAAGRSSIAALDDTDNATATATSGMPTPLTGKRVRRVLFADPVVASAADAGPATTTSTTTTSSSSPSSPTPSFFSAATTTKRQRTATATNSGGSATPTPRQRQQPPPAPQQQPPPAPQQQPQQASSPPTTPASANRAAGRATGAGAGAGADTNGNGDADDLEAEVVALLRGQPVDGAVMGRVRDALRNHALRARGLQRGRDAAREATRKAEAKAAGLQQRITDLENQRRLDAEARQKMRGGLLQVWREG